MSQSDYIKHKKLSSILKNNTIENDLDAVLSPSDYTQFKQYSLTSTIINTNPTKNQLLDDGKQRIFHMEKNIDHCPVNQFVVCNGTHTRFNRVQNHENVLFRGYKQQIPMYEFSLKRKLKTKYPTAFAEYPDLQDCDVFGECDQYHHLRDERSTDEVVSVFVG